MGRKERGFKGSYSGETKAIIRSMRSSVGGGELNGRNTKICPAREERREHGGMTEKDLGTSSEGFCMGGGGIEKVRRRGWLVKRGGGDRTPKKGKGGGAKISHGTEQSRPKREKRKEKLAGVKVPGVARGREKTLLESKGGELTYDQRKETSSWKMGGRIS